MSEKNPIQDTLWSRCFFELYSEANKNRAPSLDLTKVDELVSEKAKMPTKELIDFLS